MKRKEFPKDKIPEFIKEIPKTGWERRGLFRCGLCSKEFETSIRSIQRKHTKSCGCWNKNSSSKETHGLSKIIEYRVWHYMKTRCYNENTKKYKDYGGRGISVCDEWKNSFEQFYKDMGPRPGKGYSIHRKNDGNYCKENCVWATQKEQMNSMRRNHILEYNGEKRTVSEWSKIVNITPGLIYARLKLGWSIEKTLTTPVRKIRIYAN